MTVREGCFVTRSIRGAMNETRESRNFSWATRSEQDSTKHWREVFQSLRVAHPSSGGPPGGGGSLALALGGWSCLAGGTVLGKLSMFTGQVRQCSIGQNVWRQGVPVFYSIENSKPLLRRTPG